MVAGGVMGFSLGILVSYVQPPDWEQYHTKLGTRDDDQDFDVNRESRSVKKFKLLCWIMTNPNNHKSKALYVKWTWSKRCDKVLFMSSAQGIRPFI